MERTIKIILSIGWAFILFGIAFALAMFSILQEHKPLGDPSLAPATFPALRAHLIERYGKLPGLEDLATHPDPHARWRQYIARSCVRGLMLVLLGIGLVSRQLWGRYIVLIIALCTFTIALLEISRFNALGIPLSRLLLNRIGILAGGAFLVAWHCFPSNKAYFRIAPPHL